MLLRTAVIFLLVKLISSQNPSPCPSIFAYEPKGPEDDRWYGRVTVTTPDELNGIWLKIILDRPADLLGNWFGEATSSDNKEYVIKNSQYHFQPNRDPLSIRFFVKYNTASRSVPSVAEIRLNGKVICSGRSGTTTTQAPQLHLSNVRPTTGTDLNQRRTTTTSTTTQSTLDQGNSDDDFFPGDFSGSRPTIVLSSNIGIQGASCGTVKIPARPLITYGQSTTEGEWPWHAALYRYKGVNMQYICGGSLISANHIITAAHCVTKSKTGVAINPELLVIYLGKHNLYKLGASVQSLQVSRISVHPEYNGTYFHNDVALLKLESAAEITDFVRTVCLWEEDTSLNSVVEKLGTVVGWGFDQNGDITENLMQAKMPVVSTETCIYSNPEFFSRFTSTKTYCAGFRNGTSACTGDSGGGMVFPKSGTNGRNIVWQLRGVISLSAALQNEKVVCDTSNYIVFTDIAKHLTWIRTTMNSR